MAREPASWHFALAILLALAAVTSAAAGGTTSPSTRGLKAKHGDGGKREARKPANRGKGPAALPGTKQQAGQGKAGKGKPERYPMSNKGKLEPGLGAKERLELSLRLLDHLRTVMDGGLSQPQLSDDELHAAKARFLLEMGVQGGGKATADARRQQGARLPESKTSQRKRTPQKVGGQIAAQKSPMQRPSVQPKGPLEILRGLARRAMGGGSVLPAEARVAKSMAHSGPSQGVRPGPLFQGQELMKCDGRQLQKRSPKAAEEERKAGGVDGMSFWFLLNVTEQLSKARMHLSDSIFLANRLGRTIVLPNVGGSKLDAHQSLPFCTYYDVDSVSQLTPWVTQDFLIGAYRRLQMLPRVLLLILGAECPSDGTSNPVPGHGGVPGMPPKLGGPVDPLFSNFQLRCFGKKDLGKAASLAGRPAPALGPGQKTTRDGLQVVASGTEAARGSQPSRQRRLLEPAGAAGPAPVVALTKDSPFFAYDQFLYRRTVRRNAQRIKYAPHLVRAAERLVAAQGDSFLAIHWRFERLFETKGYEKRLDSCARGLVQSARALQQRMNLKWIFLASDIGPDGALLSSSMDRPAAQQQLQAARAWRRRIEQELRPVTWHSVVGGWDQVDSGVKGILDKIVCAEAKAFLHAPRDCEGSIGVFLRDILASRQTRPSQPWHN